MSQKISQLPAVIAANIQDTDVLPLVATNITSKVTVANLRTKLGTQPPTGGRTVTSAFTYLTNNAVYNIKDFGAFGDGVTDDTAAINTTYAAAPNGGTVLIPIGNFRFTSKLSFNREVNIIGLGPGSALVPDLNSTTVDAVVVNDTVSTLVSKVRLDNFAILSNKVNASRDTLVINRVNLSEINVHVMGRATRYGTRLVGCLLSKFRIVATVNYSYPYSAAMSTLDTVRIQYDTTNAMGFNNNTLEVKIEGGSNGVWIENQSNQGNNTISGVIEGTSAGTRGFYALGCIGLQLTNLHCEANNGAVELDTCSASVIGGGSQFLPNGNAGKVILTACSRIRLDAAYCDTLDIGATCSDILRSPAFRTGAGGGVITDTARVLRTETGAISATIVNAPTGVAQTLLDASTRGQGSYEVRVSGTNVGSTYMAEATIIFDGTNAAKIRGTDGANLNITLVGALIKATQNSGGNLTFGWTILFIPN